MRQLPRLRLGDKVALVTPAGPIKIGQLRLAVEIVESFGLIPTWSDKVHKHYGYLAGTDQQRVEQIVEAFSNPNIKAVFSIRGGFGTTRIIDKIPYRLIKRNPKILVGFSDITALQMAFFTQIGFPSVHTNLLSLKHKYTAEIFKSLTFSPQPVTLTFETDFTPQPTVISAGKSRGILIGGNLSLITSLIGTKFLPKFKGKIVFLEDVNEPPYKIDRMLTHLFMATDIKKASGIILGIFNKCSRQDHYQKPDQSLSLSEVFLEKFQGFDIPIVGGFPLGHIDKMSVLPFGAYVELSTEPLQLKILKPIVK